MNVLVLGGAIGVIDEAYAALDLGEFDGVITINDVTVEWKGPILAAVSLHGEKWPLWLHRRAMKGYPPPERVYAHTNLKKSSTPHNPRLITHFVDHLWPGQNDSGSSGLFGVKVAMDEFRADRVVLAGIPMTAEGRHYFNVGRDWGGAANHRKGWNQVLPRLTGRVRSMSGWTRTRLGAPTVEWLATEVPLHGEAA